MSERTFELVKYPFSPTELRELGSALARETQEGLNLAQRKAAQAAEISAQIKQVDRQCAELATKINHEWELREVECLTILDQPRPGMKRIIRVDNNEIIRDEAMSLQELQASFGFGVADDEDGKTRGGGE